MQVTGMLDNFMEVIRHIPEGVKHIVDGVSIVGVVATVMNALPEISAVLSIIWVVIRIYETKTIQNLLPCNRRKKKDES